jgi:D-amino-acid dehydrogenase
LRHAVDGAGIARSHARVTGLQTSGTGAVLTLDDGGTVRARHVVLAAGAWSRPLANAAGARVPLDTERGYHIEFDMETPPVSRPVTPLSRGMYLSPMTGRLRVAGTVELGGLAAPPSPHRLDILERGARSLFPDLPQRSRDWMGFRPSLPDSVPVIGRVADGPVICAFGHGHLGLTLAPITARIVAAGVTGRPAGLDVAPYRPGRF